MVGGRVLSVREQGPCTWGTGDWHAHFRLAASKPICVGSRKEWWVQTSFHGTAWWVNAKKGKGKEGKKAEKDVFFGLSLELSLCLHWVETSGVHLSLSPTTPLCWEKAAEGVRTEKCSCSSVSKCFTAIRIYRFSPSTLSPLPPHKIRRWAQASRQEGSLLLLSQNPMQCL